VFVNRVIVEELEKVATGLNNYEYSVCGYVYDPYESDPENGIKPGTSFEKLPAGWICPLCDADKSVFIRLS